MDHEMPFSFNQRREELLGSRKCESYKAGSRNTGRENASSLNRYYITLIETSYSFAIAEQLPAVFVFLVTVGKLFLKVPTVPNCFSLTSLATHV